MASGGVQTRAAKRLRTSENGEKDSGDNPSLAIPVAVPLPIPATREVSHPQWRRDPQYYFEDGNVVILAEITIFRVHKGILSLHSSVFKDMLSLPQPVGAETVDGCPLIRIPDAAFRVQWLLDTMYRGSTTHLLHATPSQRITIQTLYHLSWIGDKYAVSPLVDYVHKYLLVLFHAEKLEQWEPFSRCMIQHAQISSKSNELADLSYTARMIRKWHPRAAHLLPLIFYNYCQLPLNEVAGAPSQLPPEDMQRCLLAIPQLLTRKIEICNVFTTLKTLRTTSCLSRCNSSLCQLSHSVMKRSSMATLPCPLEDLLQWCRQRKHWGNLCSSCTRTIEQEISRLRQKTWNDLGKIFNILEWRTGDVQQT
ncbi:hypothetical protein BDY19DRAFT_944766 [Irpex rosettiformis]|uniref:Uncharacterized protein n=1 Tax=Irpex rosettiformis TaxID=378272 RepID=A0ACB8U4Q8_9APHY|nr:hypothetical protein BDY19DRAFT_944766 [Irpex rosettiformis]